MTLEPQLAELTTTAFYLVVLGFVFVESGLLFGFFLPGDSVLFAAGILAATPGSGVSLPVLVLGVFAAAVLGDAVGYACGHRLGRPYLLRRSGRLGARHVERAERFYARYGWFAVVVARWIPWVRTFTPVIAGIGRMPYHRFLSANVLGALCWAVGLVLLGYFSYATPWLRTLSLVVAGVFITATIGYVVVEWRRARRRPLAGGDALVTARDDQAA
ncbi:DedA family protein [Carbonactinospora thermoautotrophica]|nr:DedA family protein [Carbonactinospora thermoautotrophica]